MTGQLSLGYSPEHAGREDWRSELDWARSAVDSIGHKHVAYALDIAPSTLTDALKERDGKGLRAEHLTIIRRLAPSGLQAEWLRIVARPLGHETNPIKTRTPEEKLRAVLDVIERGAPFLLGAIAKEIGP